MNSENAVVPKQEPSVTEEMVSRFLAWRLPADFGPDAGISFKPYRADMTPDSHLWPVGTNLLTYPQARAMLEHVLKAPAGGSAGVSCVSCGAMYSPFNGILRHPPTHCRCEHEGQTVRLGPWKAPQTIPSQVPKQEADRG